jgi:hypothetical protein
MSFPSYHSYVGTKHQRFDGILNFVKVFKLQYDIGVEKLKELEKNKKTVDNELDTHYTSNNLSLINSSREKYCRIEKQINDLFGLLYVNSQTKLYLDLYDIFCEPNA